MYYIKHNSQKIELYGDEIFSTCPICGREINIELEDTIGDNGRIRFDSDTFCDTCTTHRYTKKYVEAVNNDTWNPDNTICFVEDEKVRRQLIKDGFKVYVCPVTGSLRITDDNGTEYSLDLYVALLRCKGSI